jgi:hypothetical protein
MSRALVLVMLAGCPRPPPPPSVTEPPRLAAEESCASPPTMPALPARTPIDPFRLTHPAQMIVTADGANVPVTFLCDLPDQILGIGATQTVDGGKRVVGGTVYAHPRVATARAIPKRMSIAASSPGCKQGELSCVFETEVGKIEMLRDQWVNTSGWVHGIDDMCRALPDDTIAVCSTATRMAYVELGCDGQLHMGIHDASLERTFDLDVETPVIRMRGSIDHAAPDSASWKFRFTSDAKSVAAPTTKAPANAELAIEVTPPGVQIDKGGQLGAQLVLDGAMEPCIAWAIYRR